MYLLQASVDYALTQNYGWFANWVRQKGLPEMPFMLWLYLHALACNKRG
jgi:hypothetical protein